MHSIRWRAALSQQWLRPAFSWTGTIDVTPHRFLTTTQDERSDEKRASALVAPKRPLNILFFGSSAIAIPVLDALKEAQAASAPTTLAKGYPLVGELEVVCPPAKRTREKKATILDYAESSKLPVHTLPPKMDFRMTNYTMPTMSSSGNTFDLGVVISFGYFIRPDMIDAMPMGMINAHGSLLPKFRGASPIQHAILHGEKTTGITVTTIHPKVIDLGRVLDQSEIPIHPDATYATLVDELGEVARKSVIDVLANWDEKYTQSKDQADLLQNTASLPNHLRHAGKILSHGPLARAMWSQKTAKQIYDNWRALAGFVPFYTYFKPRPVDDLPEGVKPPPASLMRQQRMILREAVGYALPGSRSLLQYSPHQLDENAIPDSTTPGKIEVDNLFKVDRAPNGVIRVRCRDGVDVLFTAVQFEGDKVMDTVKFGTWLKTNRILDPYVHDEPEPTTQA